MTFPVDKEHIKTLERLKSSARYSGGSEHTTCEIVDDQGHVWHRYVGPPGMRKNQTFEEAMKTIGKAKRPDTPEEKERQFEAVAADAEELRKRNKELEDQLARLTGAKDGTGLPPRLKPSFGERKVKSTDD